jgi:hypothetical protein
MGVAAIAHRYFEDILAKIFWKIFYGKKYFYFSFINFFLLRYFTIELHDRSGKVVSSMVWRRL